MVYDCFPFFNELDILKLRLEIMDQYVDKFVLEEATVTFSGEPKALIYKENEAMFSKWKDKIIHIVVDECPKGLASHDMDHFQKDHLLLGLKDCKENDICIFSDVDEIPNPEILPELFQSLSMGKIYHLAQRMFYCYLNMEEVSGKLLSNSGEFEGVDHPMWLGTKVFLYGSLQGRGFWDLRDKKAKVNGIRIPNGGWHFGYMGGSNEADLSKRIGEKVVAAAHQEYNEKEILSDVVDRIKDGQDIFGRDAKFVMCEIDDTYPAYIRNHQKELSHLIMQSESEKERVKRHRKRKIRKLREKANRGVRKIGRMLHLTK